jgi:hypothetical protein
MMDVGDLDEEEENLIMTKVLNKIQSMSSTKVKKVKAHSKPLVEGKLMKLQS